jgi:hypothetical protein
MVAITKVEITFPATHLNLSTLFYLLITLGTIEQQTIEQF